MDCVGNENEFCCDAQRCVVADQSGRIYWCSEKKVYSIRIGSPKDVIIVDAFKERDIVKLQTFGNYLFVYSKNSSGKTYSVNSYIITPEGVKKNEMGYGLYHIIVVDANSVGFRYLQIGSTETEFVNEIGERKKESELIGKSALNEKTFYLNGVVVSGVRAVGCDKDKNYILIN